MIRKGMGSGGKGFWKDRDDLRLRNRVKLTTRGLIIIVEDEVVVFGTHFSPYADWPH